MSRSGITLRANGGRNRDLAHIKTYLVEALLPEDSPTEKTAEFIESLFPRVSGRGMGAISLSRAKNDTLMSVNTAVAGEKIEAYLDFTNSRFWLLHSMSKSDSVDRLVSGWIDDLPELDRAWFPVGLLDQYSQLGSLRGIGLEYDNSWIKNDESETSNADVFKMQLRSRQAARVLSTLRSDSGEPEVARLSKVVVAAMGGKAVSDIKYDGRITGRGKSFEDHLSVVHNVFDRYAEQVRFVEEEYAISALRDENFSTLTGSPITFQLRREIEDLKRFCDGMFSSAAPFRLWGDPIRESDKTYRVQALDLHSARTLSFEITSRFLRVYLPKGSCGNSILRLYTNIQARYDAMVTAVNGDGELVFGF